MDEIAIFRDQLSLSEVEAEMKASDNQIDIPLKHTFGGGVYARQIFIPEGTLIIGKRHRHETLNMLLSGELSLYMGEGKPAKKIKGPLMFTSQPGVKKLAYCNKDAIFINFHPTKETDLEKIESEFIISEQEYLEEQGKIQCHG